MICITGIGIVSALGIGVDANRSMLRDLRSGIAPVRFLDTVHRDLPVGEVPASDNELRSLLGLPDDWAANRTVLLGKLALREALSSARVKDKVRTAFLNGTTVGGMDRTEQALGDILKGAKAAPDVALHDCGATTCAIADGENRWELVSTLSTACSSATNAMIVGAELIQSGRVDCVVAGGAECLSRFHLNGFNALMILDHQRCRPFADDRAGLNLGEGAAYLVLESEKTARARKTQVLGYLSGWENACDAFHQTASSPDGEGAYRAMTGALRSAGLSPADIAYINAHGTGTPNNDETELAAMHRVFGSGLPPFASTKWLTGHTTSASGSIEAAFCIMGLNAGFMPGLSVKPARSLRHVLCNSFGFGGNDAAVVLSAPDAPPAVTPSVASVDRPVLVIEAAAQISCQQPLSDAWLRTPDLCSGPVARTIDPNFGEWISPAEARRMGLLLKRTLTNARRTLGEAGISVPDAIITGTGLGNIEDSEQCLLSMLENGETSVSPTRFMLSTHNTFSSLIAIATEAHGYNATYSHRGLSFESALADACLRLRRGLAGNVLLNAVDGMTDNCYRFLCSTGELGLPEQYPASEAAASFLLRAVSPDEIKDKIMIIGHRLFHQPTAYELGEAVRDMVLEQGVPFETIPVVFAAYSGVAEDFPYYGAIFSDIFQELRPAYYSRFLGVSFSTPALAFYMAFRQMQSIPGQVGILLFNNSKSGASLTLLGKNMVLL